MARIAGINIPDNKHACISLTYIYGIGRTTAVKICEATGIDPASKIGELTEESLDAIRGEIAAMKELTNKPFGVNIAQAFVRDPGIVDFVVDNGIKFVSTSAGDPRQYTAALKYLSAVEVSVSIGAKWGGELVIHSHDPDQAFSWTTGPG